MSLNRVWLPSPNYSSRSGATVKLIVLHTAEGARTYQDLGAFFQNKSVEASSHVGIDDTPGTIGEYVKRDDKAWTCANYNGVSVNVELCGFADWSTDTWKNQHHQMLENCAQWIAEEAAHYGIPITALSPGEAQGGMRGVCQHKDLGAAGGGHHDCGPGFPMNYVLDLARGTAPKPEPEPTPEDKMIATATNKDGRVLVFVEKDDGRVFRAYQKDDGSWGMTEDGKKILWQAMGNPGK